MIYSEQDKKLVDQYKQTNIILRKQLNNLNNEIDRILIRRSNKIGLQKLPNVNKKIVDPNIMQHETQNLRKRVELLQKDLQAYKTKSNVNYYERIKQMQGKIQQKQLQMQQCKRLIKQYERKDKIADVQNSKNSSKVDNKIAKLQQEIGRCQKIEKDLIKQISYQQSNTHKANSYLNHLTLKYEEASIRKQKQAEKVSPPKIIESQPPASIGQQEWKQLKRQFLVFKETKQNQQYALNQQNQRLRTQIKEWDKKIKDKKKRIQSMAELNQRNKERQSRVYSTLNDPNQNKVYRYRQRNNSIQYNTKQ